MLIREAGRKDTLEHAWGGLKTPAMEAGLMPADITAEWVWSLEAEAAGGNRRQSLRKGAAVFDELFDIPAIADSGLLPPNRIGSGPVYNRSGKVKASLPSQLAQISKNASSSQKSAISAVWRAIVASDLTFSDDPSPVEILAVQGQIAELPASLAGVSEGTWSLYQGRFRAALRKEAQAHAVE